MRLRSTRRWVLPLIAFCTAAVIYLSGATALLDRQMMDARFRLLPRSATGSLVIVAIDPKSLGELDSWPWPRTFHAQLIGRLMAAGARTVALDIDFSSRSTPTADAALDDAVAKAGGRIVLPMFRQGTGGVVYLTRPFHPIGERARLASVTVQPEPDGLVRRALEAEDIEGTLHPSLSAELAGERVADRGSFYIDYGISPMSIPMLSYADVLAGRFDPAAVTGKAVIVGATAVELGDRLAVPIYRSLPGPVLQALAYESLVQGRAIHTVRQVAVLLVALLVAIVLGPRFERRSWRWGIVTTLAVSAASFGVALLVQLIMPVSLDVTPFIMTTVFCLAANVIGQVERQARELIVQGMEILSKGAMLRGVVEDSFDGIVITDQRGTVEIFNDAAARLLGRTAEEAAGRPITELLALPFELEADRTENETASAGFDRPCEIELSQRDGSVVTAELVVSTSVIKPVRGWRGGEPERRGILIFTFRDVSERRRALAAQVAATEAAMASNRAKTEFLTNMSHELRTPLNAIIGFSDMLQQQIFGPVGDPHYSAYVKDIYDSGVHLRDVVNDILDVSKIEAGKLELNEDVLDIAQVVEKCVRMVTSRAETQSIRLVMELPSTGIDLAADSRLIKQSLLNLLSNAVKFTPEGGSVTIAVAQGDDGRLLVRVSDTGIGIAAEHIPRLAEPFYQIDSSLARSHEGTGLGLYLVSKFMALHDGQLAIDSEPGKGTTVTLQFPASRVSRTPSAAAA